MDRRRLLRKQTRMPQDTLMDVSRIGAENMIQEVTDMAYGYLTVPRVG